MRCARGMVGCAVVLGLAAVRSFADIEVRPASAQVVGADERIRVAFLVINQSDARLAKPLTVTCDHGTVDAPTVTADLAPHESHVFTVSVRIADDADAAAVVVSGGTTAIRVTVRRGLDLTLLPWRRKLADRKAGPNPALAGAETTDASWERIYPPTQWQENDYAWCRVHFSAPDAWKGRRLRVAIGAVDDNDITYLNGVEIGRTNGWDRLRDYALPQNVVKYGGDNVLTVMVDNPTFGGGLYKSPIAIVVGNGPIDTPSPPSSVRAARPAPGRIGDPLPLRMITADHGVLRYPDGAEVALWGVNYYPQSWFQFDNMKKLGVDMKATMRTDLDHMQRMGVQAIRIHVFDREISDGAGNLVRNEHLDLLDYLASECSRRGIYLYLTPIAWWGGPNQRADAFSTRTSKPGMMFVPAAIRAEANYLRNFLGHTNPYTGRKLKDETCLRLLEVMNEPAYFLEGDLQGKSYDPQGETAEVLARDHATFLSLWREWLKRNDLPDTPTAFPLFRYQLMSAYIHEMIAAIRSAGADQPIAINYFGANGDDITQAIADSACDAVTVSAYPGGWEHVNDGMNMIPNLQPIVLPASLASKARIAYEFDTPGTNTSCYLYPFIAAMFRNTEVQVACQFQYDSVSTAKWNTDWGAHWLNWLYTPTKAASYMVASRTFRTTPRGTPYSPKPTELRTGQTYASFTHNVSLFATPEVAIYSRSTAGIADLKLPQSPSRIVGVGSSSLVDYGGTGIYEWVRTGPTSATLTIDPDARLVGNSLVGSLATPSAELESHAHVFVLKMAGWGNAKCFDARGHEVPRAFGGWVVTPGRYTMRRK